MTRVSFILTSVLPFAVTLPLPRTLAVMLPLTTPAVATSGRVRFIIVFEKKVSTSSTARKMIAAFLTHSLFLTLISKVIPHSATVSGTNRNEMFPRRNGGFLPSSPFASLRARRWAFNDDSVIYHTISRLVKKLDSSKNNEIPCLPLPLGELSAKLTERARRLGTTRRSFPTLIPKNLRRERPVCRSFLPDFNRRQAQGSRPEQSGFPVIYSLLCHVPPRQNRRSQRARSFFDSLRHQRDLSHSPPVSP